MSDLLDAYLVGERMISAAMNKTQATCYTPPPQLLQIQIQEEPVSGIPKSTLPEAIAKAERLTVGQLREAMKNAPNDTEIFFHQRNYVQRLRVREYYLHDVGTFFITFEDDAEEK